jgi:predicted DNA-binding protein YlxM (UPF0122 family)
MKDASTDSLENRFERLRRLLDVWRYMLQQKEKEVLQCFYQDDLSGIARLMDEKKRLAIRIQHIQAFVDKWEFIESRIFSQDRDSQSVPYP